jgi:hypothetical protein
VIEAAVKVLPPSGADRAIAVPSEGGYFVAVADGAGGTGGGASAADRLIVALTKLTAQAAWADWWSVLLELDEELAGRGGETTAYRGLHGQRPGPRRERWRLGGVAHLAGGGDD